MCTPGLAADLPHWFTCDAQTQATNYRLYMQAFTGKKARVAESAQCDFLYVAPKGRRIFTFSSVNATGETMREDVGVFVDGRLPMPPEVQAKIKAKLGIP